MVTRQPKGAKNSAGGQFTSSAAGARKVPQGAPQMLTARERREEADAKAMVAAALYQSWKNKTAQTLAESLVEQYKLVEIPISQVWEGDKILLLTSSALHFGVVTSDGGTLEGYSYENVYLDGIPLVTRKYPKVSSSHSYLRNGPVEVEEVVKITGATAYR